MTEYLSDLYVGERAAGISVPPKFDAISKVVLLVDDENYYEAGNGTGRTLELTCPYGTQEMANNILASVSGYQYQPVTATDALADPAVELGDSMTVGGAYSIVAQREIDFGLLLPMELAAPGQEEIESEYPYVSQQQSETNRQIAETRSEIKKTSTEIQLSVENQINDLSASIDIQLDSITSTIQGQGGQISQINQTLTSINSTIQGLDGAISEIDQKVDNIRISVSNGSTSSTITLTVDGVTVSSQNITMSGLVTYTGLSSGTTTIDGACIKTGTIDADRLNLTGAITFGDLSSSVQNDINDAYSMASQAQADVSDISSTVDDWSYSYRGTTYIDGTRIMSGTVTASTIQGGVIELLDSSERTAGEISLSGSSSSSYAVDIYSNRALRLTAGSGDVYIENGSGDSIWLDASQGAAFFDCTIVPNGDDRYNCGTSPNRWAAVYSASGVLTTSDELKKNTITALPEKYITLLDNLEPVMFKYDDGTSGRFHTGFIAQDVKMAMDAAGVTDMEFAGWCQDVDAEGNDTYFLRYHEFAALMLAKIKQLEARIAELEVA